MQQPMKSRILITGCNGLLGQKLVQVFAKSNEILGIDRDERPLLNGLDFEYRMCDITQGRKVKALVREFKPDVIIHTAAYTDVDRSEVEKELCWKVNALGTENLAHAAFLQRAKLIYISTDYVFDGKKGYYTEDDRPDPINYYGKSKLAGENAIRSIGVDYFIARTAVLYGRPQGGRLNFVTWLIEKLRQGEQVNIVDDQIGNPTLADDLAEALKRVVEMKASGLYHLAGREAIDRLSFSRKIAQLFGLEKRLIRPIKTADLNQLAPRPLNASLSVERARLELGLQLFNVEEGLQALKRQFGSDSEA